MNIETTFFKATDGVNLKGVMYKNQSKTNKVLISIHGMATNCLKERDEKIAEKANELNIDFFAFNNRGHDIVNYIKKEMNLAIGSTTAEQIKIEIGCAMPLMSETSMQVSGRDLGTGLPETVTVTSTQIQEAMQDSIEKIIDIVKQTLEKTPPELASDIMEKGIVLAGGRTPLNTFDQSLFTPTTTHAYVTEDPLDCVVKGTGKTIDDLERLKSVLINSRRKR